MYFYCVMLLATSINPHLSFNFNVMRKLKSHSALTALMLLLGTFSFAQNEQFIMRQLACGLSQPWEIKFGPDGFLWVTEAHSYQITRVDPVTGNAQLLIDLSNRKNFENFTGADVWPQGGLQGIAFHPNFNTNPYFYVAYVYDFDSCLSDTRGCFFKTKIVRYNYNMGTNVLSNETVLIDTIPGSSDHNGGRLVVGPAAPSSGGPNFLFYSVGDMGAGHAGSAERINHAQDVEIYEGKILRFNLLQDTDTDGFDRWIPNDNPFNSSERQSAVWSVGHRNPQGLVFSPGGTLYESEHGPYSDDEINIIKRGNNYGWPLIVGYADGNYDGSKGGRGFGIPEVGSEVGNRVDIEASFPYSEPIGSYFPVSQSEVSTYFTNDYNNTPPYPNYYLQYPNIAPSGIDYYSSDAIPGWKNSILVATLKLASVYRLKLASDGSTIIGDTISYFKGLGRFRDIAISPDGKKIYVSADSVGVIKGAPGQAVVPPNKGCILEFSFQTTGIDEALLDQKIQVFPNPTELGITNLSLNLDYDAEVSIILYDITGQMITTVITEERGKTFDKRIDMNRFQPGNYFLKVSIDGTIVVRKLVHF